MSGINKGDILRAKECVERHLRTIDNRRTQLGECQRFIKVHTDGKCWACKHTGPTTDLVQCEIANPRYPDMCRKFEAT